MSNHQDGKEGLVSVVIPAFNAGKFITKAIDSVLEQTYENIEIIIVNDGSTDNTLEIVNSYENRVSIYNQENSGLCEARNTGIKRRQGEFIAFLDADDYWMPDKIMSQVKLLNNNSDVGFCSTATKVEHEGSETRVWACPIVNGSMLRTIFAKNAAIPGSGSGVMVRASVLRTVGLFDNTLKSLEDIDMWMRLAAITEYGCINEQLTVILKNNDSMSGNLDVMRRSAIQVMKKNRKLLPAEQQNRFWRYAYAGVIADYAKWEFRRGLRISAVVHLLQGFLISPFGRGRLIASLLYSVVTGKLN